MDILLAGSGSDNIIIAKIYNNNGSNVFADQTGAFLTPVPTVYDNYTKTTILWTDFDNDGYLDIIFNGFSATLGNTVMVYRNQTNNTFLLKTTIDYLTTENGILEPGDYDNDGDNDFLLATNSSIRIYQNQGNFVFEDKSTISSQGLSGGSAKWGDYDNDNDLDLLISGGIYWNAKSYIYQNQGSNNFVRQDQIDLTWVKSGTSEWGDYNNDGYLDILLSGNSNYGVFLNNGNGTFSYQSSIALDPVTYSAGKWGDLDNDGDLDIIHTGENLGTPITRIYSNNGNNTFTQAPGVTIDAVKEGSIDLIDIDNDGDLDLLITGNKGTSKITKVFLNSTPAINTVPVSPTGLISSVVGSEVILKWNKVTTDNTSKKSLSYSVMAGTSPGFINLVSPGSSTTTGARRTSGMGNGQLDTMFVLRNIPKGTYYWKVQAIDNSFKGSPFSIQGSFIYNVNIQAYALKTTNIGGTTASLSWARGNGTNCIVFLKEGNSGSALPINSTTYTASPVFKSGTQIGSGWYCIYKGTQSSVNVSGLKTATEYIFQVFEFEGNPGAEVYNNQVVSGNPVTFGTGTFSEITASSLLPVNDPSFGFERSTSNNWFDFDNDNDLDLLIVGTKTTLLYRNDGNDIFVLTSVAPGTGYAAATSDINNDGNTDFIIDSNPVKLFLNNGNSTFSEVTGTGFIGTNYGGVSWGDYDNDGDQDLVLQGETISEGRISKVYRNNGNNTFTEQTGISLEGVHGIGAAAKWGDYDNDGFLDLIISGFNNSADPIAKIYRNNTAGNFVEQTNISIPTYYGSALDWGDYDNDGDLDIVMAKASGSCVYQNAGNNNFTILPDIPLVAAQHGSASWGDYDNDGDLDILLSGFTSDYLPQTKVYRNNGDNTFTEDVSCKIPGIGWGSSNWGDYDKDGDLDIIISGVTTETSVSKIFRNDIVTANVNPVAPTGLIADVVNSDVTLKWRSVRTDNTPYKAMSYNLKVGTSTGGVNVVSPHSAADGFRKQTGMGNANLDTTFILKKLPMGNYYWSVQAIDNGYASSPFATEGTFSIIPVQAKKLSAKIIDPTSLSLKWERGNGDRCVVFCKQTSTGVAVPVNNTGYIADPEYSFGGQIGTSGWYCVYNGRADSVIVTGLVSSKQYSFHIFEYLGTFGSEQYFTQTSDGNPGVFSTSLFTEQAGIAINPGWNNNIAWGDYDNDGFIDVLVPGFPTRIYRNKGDNSFEEKTAIALTNINWGTAAWGDYDSDGDLDIIITGATVTYPTGSPVTKIYRNEGADTFTEQSSISIAPLLFSSVAWGDYDNDGDLDIIINGATGTDPNYVPSSKIYNNNGDNTFTEQTQLILTGLYRGSVRWVDYDNDGDLDIAMTGSLAGQLYQQGVFEIYKNNGDKTFSLQTDIALTGFGYSATSWGDYDNDQDLDFMITTMGSMTLYQNNGNNSFVQHMLIGLAYQGACYAAWGDYDNDGWLDIILTNPGLDTRIYRNTHGLTVPGAITQWFNPQDNEAVKSIGYSFVNWIDYDNDGDLDFLFTKDNGTPTKIFKNNLIMKSGKFNSNTSPAAPMGLKASNSPTGVVLSWKPVFNDETPSKTMTYNVRIGTSKAAFNTCPPESSATGYRKIASVGNAQVDTTFLLVNMPAVRYYWSVQAVDQGLKGGSWSVTDSVDVKNVLSFFTADTICEGLSTQFTNQSVAFGDVIQGYKWLFGDGTSSTLASPSHLFSSAGVKNVTLIAYSATTSDTLTKQVLVKAKPGVNFNASVVCQGSETVLTNISNVTGLTITSWSWDYGDGKGSTVQNPGTHGYLTAGDYQLTLTAVADNLCSSFITKTVSVGAYPVAAISASTPLSFCSGDSVSLSVAKNATYIYKWQSGGVYLPGQDSSKYVAKITGTYTAEVVNPTGNCKTTSTAASVTVLNAPSSPGIISAKTPAVFCQGDSVSLSVTNTSGYSYSWKLNGGAVGSNKNEYFAKNSGRYTLTVANNTGCIVSSSNFIDVTVNPLPSVSAVTPGGATTFCDGGNVTLSVPFNAGYSYSWSNESVPVPNALTNSYTANTTGKYELVVTNSSGCVTKTTAVNVTVKPMPLKPSVTSSDYVTGQCPPTEIKVKLAAQEVSGYTYQWLRNGVVYPDKTLSFIEEYLPEGVYAVEATLNGCKAVSDNFSISYATAPEIPKVYAKGPAVWYLASQFKSYKYYKWYYNDQLISGANKYIYVANKKLGSYRVAVANDNLCYTSSTAITIPTTKSGMTDFNIPSEYLVVEETEQFAEVKVYPNPGNGLFNIETDNEQRGEVEISVFRFDGKEIHNVKSVKDSEHYLYQIDLTGQPRGNYLIYFDLDKITTVKKIIIE
ncbi:MAG: VCBS repeat-containing protein [Bacteroidales bacterium]|nr:VCBS repeat-containing protein [Bacteroidales bacterium]